jgi:hypothetical protein
MFHQETPIRELYGGGCQLIAGAIYIRKDPLSEVICSLTKPFPTARYSKVKGCCWVGEALISESPVTGSECGIAFNQLVFGQQNAKFARVHLIDAHLGLGLPADKDAWLRLKVR